MEILEKVAYMKGLAEGIGLDVKSKEGKLLKVMMDILDDIALELQDLRTGQEDLEDGLDAVSDDLSEVESCLFEAEDGEETDGVYQTTCPNCGEELEFDLSDLSGCGGCCGGCAGADEDKDKDDEDDDEE